MLADTLRQTHFPYCMQRQGDGRYVITNRNYKPLGFMTGQFVSYEDHPISVSVKNLTPEVASQLDHRGRDNLDAIYLYGDGNNPELGNAEAQAYFERLGILMSLEIEED
ncbi:hypothetical protein [Halomonas elongata]|uniref:Uncharacterized protein n=1 Tax=Halomonas elongata (strain ATCC 33173 / DSM 2581 / NBRC 15536 / NCIMB 2198 / 1H9) TaxID=768066 RepID=E1VAY1_HALED|nr:hypothetical protein [Halomonas elongata]WBF17838.1 hypothetical protein LM502_17500 [Halomonas elongata]WPU46683.1 hypothetical protein SR933_15750 [Halomonas elongata DSM 2581]CBV44080.1 uncharacterized protein HELO_4196 [Halomonas elongata DSM 2581]